jgi:hypothetical protein
MILNLGTRCRWVFSFTPRSLYPREEIPDTHWLGGRVGPKAGKEAVEKRKISFALTGNLTPAFRPVSHHYNDFYFFLTALLDGSQLLASRSGLFDPKDSGSLCSLVKMIITAMIIIIIIIVIKLRGNSQQANYTERATAACRRSQCQHLWIEGVAWTVQRIPTAVNLDFLDPEQLLFHSSSSSVILTRLSGPRSRPTTSQKIW